MGPCHKGWNLATDVFDYIVPMPLRDVAQNQMNTRQYEAEGDVDTEPTDAGRICCDELSR